MIHGFRNELYLQIIPRLLKKVDHILVDILGQIICKSIFQFGIAIIRRPIHAIAIESSQGQLPYAQLHQDFEEHDERVVRIDAF